MFSIEKFQVLVLYGNTHPQEDEQIIFPSGDGLDFLISPEESYEIIVYLQWRKLTNTYLNQMMKV